MGLEADEFSQGVEIIGGLYYFVAVKRPDAPRYSAIAQSNITYCIDDELLYEPFFADFGPLNLGRAYRFCMKTKQLLQEAEKHGKRLYLYAGPHAHQKANAAVLVGIYQVIYLNRTADVAYKPLSVYKPFVPFRDASCGVSTFHLTVYDVIRGIQRARDVGFIDWNSGSSSWSLEEYEYYEQVENGDLNWIVPGKFVAFSGPAARSNEIAGYRLHTPEDYWDYFRRRGVAAIVRLNKKVYDRKRFLDGGFKHHEMYFPDGSCPSDAIIQRFLDTVEAEPGAVAVHCKAGLGRTGVLICCYIMKHYRFTAEEVIGYIRVCRPGSVIGPQQNFIREMESRMWHEGELYRASRGLPKVAPAVSDLVVAGRAAGQGDDTGPGRAGSNGYGNGAYGNGAYGNGAYGGSRGGMGGAGAGLMSGRSGSASSAAGPYSLGVSGMGAAPPSILAAQPSSGAVAAAAGDMSLLQYSKLQQQHGSAHGGYGADSGSAGGGGGAYSSGSFRSRYGSGSAGYGAGAGAGRSMTPLRYGQQPSAYGASSGYGASAGYGGSHHSSIQGSLQGGAPGSRGQMGLSAVSRSMPAGPTVGGGMGRSPSAGRLSAAAGLAAPPSSSISAAAGLRSTLHTDTLAAADRPKVIPERNTQSADIGSGFGGLGATSSPPGAQPASPWRIAVPASPIGSSGPATPTSPAGAGGLARAPSLGASRSGAGSGPGTPTTPGSTSGGVARILAPNGQPRKVPVALLNQYQGPSASPSGAGVGSWAASGGGAGTKSPGSAQLRPSGYASYGVRQ
ncbi:hypothetical protein HYH03_016420 [Edaphochlamys debaryana]|uniref:protein-tyrosine-phosphatase n=1 Tax=Edaphochlamys debaryana TaxID=47281 RepID=A0A836BPX1_9CHLO|nr:hypothetical protein HYH03_016420 [Edaphochlamys debaryana]|eukprot:KAG2484766.1 hypothetical protein HYH03_016420 [Edaphochlamys debaryana]